MGINTKTILIDGDEAQTQSTQGASTSAPVTIYRGTEYVFQINAYSNVNSTGFLSFNNSAGWELDIGRLYGTNASPVLVEANVASWNNVADWALASPETGLLSVRINTSGALISTDLGNASSDSYTMEIWYKNNLGSKILVLSDGIDVNNATVI